MVDPYQPAEEHARMMPRILDVLLDAPPRVFVLQTRGPLILRDFERLRALAQRTTLRVSFSITTNREEVRKLYEPHCVPIAERLKVVRTLCDAGSKVTQRWRRCCRAIPKNWRSSLSKPVDAI
jgi:DNA repair photolyase